MAKFGKKLIESMQQAAKHADGKRVRGLRLSKVELPDDSPGRSVSGPDKEDQAADT
jgi:hypothetical protein